MTVRELNRDQLEELKSAYLYSIENDFSCIGAIEDEIIFQHYDGISFVNDDFASTMDI